MPKRALSAQGCKPRLFLRVNVSNLREEEVVYTLDRLASSVSVSNHLFKITEGKRQIEIDWN